MRKLVLTGGLVVVAFACGTGADMMGEILDSGVPDAGAQDTPATCNKGEGSSRWAEFPMSNPGQTEITVCYAARPENPPGPARKANCTRVIAPWYEGTSTGFLWSCDDTMTITVHN
jgi:hypothetical protein